ncbi:2'-5' RNA ligase family protein [Micromonospora aurantiaca (nom. illeg.)]|uniref:2'-5' RNA ligase family protein n=1 Tax=Micromonospora aurantiaca (nom. illeg.) TaxID=47850 RepID=UPI003414431A
MTFEDQPELYRLADSYRSAVAAAPTATLIPDQWLHLTVQGIGFTDETSDATLGAVIEEAGKQLAQLPAVAVEFGAIVVADEAIVMPALPVQRLRAATRTAIRRVVGEDQVSEDPSRYRPHVSVAYLTADGPSEPYVQAVQSVAPDPATVSISHVDLIEIESGACTNGKSSLGCRSASPWRSLSSPTTCLTNPSHQMLDSRPWSATRLRKARRLGGCLDLDGAGTLRGLLPGSPAR